MSRVRILATSVVGNALEFYDFTLYGVFAAVIANIFFPSSDPIASVLASWGAFAAGFLMRPFGATLFGHLGDKLGRRKALTLSILLMGIPTLVIGLLPGYEKIGIVAPIVLVACRLLQGLCTGGEYNGAAVFALEHIGDRNPGFCGGLITGSCVIGALTATAFGAIATKPGMPEWAWRVPFLVGALISVIGFYIRRNISETPDFQAYKNQRRQEPRQRAPLSIALTKHTTAVGTVIFCGALNGAMSYTLACFSHTYLHQFIGIPVDIAMRLTMIGLFAYMVGAPLMGHVYDKIQGFRYFVFACSGVMLLAFPVFHCLQSGDYLLIACAQFILGIMIASLAGPQHAFVQPMFPVASRYSGISFGFCLGMALIGGTTPMVLTYLISSTGNNMMPAMYICICCIVFLGAVSSLVARASKQQASHAA